MSFVAVAVGGGALLGGIVASQGAQSAANTQADAARNAQQISENQFNTINAQNAPYMQSGYGALSALNYGLGINPQTATGGFPATPAGGNAFTSTSGAQSTPGGGNTRSLPPGVVSIQNGMFVMANGKPIMTGMTPQPGITYLSNNGQPLPNQPPITGGTSGTSTNATATQGLFPGGGAAPGFPQGGAPPGQTGGLGYGSLLAPFTMDNFQQLSPAYNFQKQQGEQGVLNADASGQGALSGSSYKDLMSFNQNLANTSFNNAFNQYQTQQGNIYSRLAGIAQMGQSSANNTGQQGTALAGQAGQAAVAAGSYLGAGQVGSANAISGGIAGAASAAPWLSAGAGGGATDYGGFNPATDTGVPATAGDYSDRRLKTDIHKVGEYPSGLPIYSFRFKAHPEQLCRGVMADEALVLFPDAITEDAQGFMMVDYRKLH